MSECLSKATLQLSLSPGGSQGYQGYKGAFRGRERHRRPKEERVRPSVFPQCKAVQVTVRARVCVSRQETTASDGGRKASRSLARSSASPNAAARADDRGSDTIQRSVKVVGFGLSKLSNNTKKLAASHKTREDRSSEAQLSVVGPTNELCCGSRGRLCFLPL